MGWLDTEVYEQGSLALDCHQCDVVDVTQVASRWQAGDEEGKRREGKGSTRTGLGRPALAEWQAYGKQYEPAWNEADANTAFDYYEANGWHQKGGASIKNWQAALRNCVGRWRMQPQATINGQRAKSMNELIAEQPANLREHK